MGTFLLKFRVFAVLCLVLLFNPILHASTGGLTGPSSSNTGTYTISWTVDVGGFLSGWSLQERVGSGNWSTVSVSSEDPLFVPPPKFKTFTNKPIGTYQYRLKYRQIWCFEWCPPPYYYDPITVSVVPAPPPTPVAPTLSISSTTSANGTYSISWTAATHATHYQWRENGGSWLSASILLTKFFVDKPDGNYSYQVRACNATCSAASNTKSITVANAPGTPASIAAPSTDNNGAFTITWGASSGTVDAYQLYQQKNGGSWTHIYSGTGTSKVVSGLGDGSYLYRVRACNTQGSYTACSGYRTESAAAVVANVPGTPTSIAAPSTDNNGAFTVSWGTSSGSVDAYQLYQQKNGGSWTHIYSGTGTSKAVSSLGDGSYLYRVRACNTQGSYTACSGYRTESVAAVVANVPGTPASIAAPSTDNNGAFTVTWGASSGTVDAYQLYQQKNGGSWTHIYSGTGTSKAVSGLGDGSYLYRVRACNTQGSYTACSGYRTESAAAVVANAPGTPTSIAAPSTDNNGTFTVSWGTSSGSVDAYQLYQQKDGGSWAQIYSGTGTSKAVSGLSDGSYLYRVRACNTQGSYTACSGYRTESAVAIVANVPGAPSSLTVPSSDNDGSYTVSWGSVAGSVDFYELQEGTNGNWGVVYSGSNTSKSVSVTINGEYDYRVRACNSESTYTSCSGWSGTSSIAVIGLSVDLNPLSDNTLAFSQPSHDETVGAIASQSSVEADGSANYSIPITAPPGVGGVQPNLALTYNSNGSNGLIGVGWGLQGLSYIHRCPATLYHDGFIDAIDYDANDQFCLDGQRLVHIGNNEYRTAIDSFSKIVASGTSGSGPSYFTVWSRDGRIMQYGGTTNSKVNGGSAFGTSGSVSIWGLNKIEDRHSNTLTVTYQQEATTTEFRPLQIDYANGNASVVFEYDPATRPDFKRYYAQGDEMTSTKRLTNIKTYSGSQLLRDYRLTYEINTVNTQSQLKTVTECAGNNSCLEPTVFEWEVTTLGLQTPSLKLTSAQTGTAVYSPHGYYEFALDVNGDGLSDWMWMSWDDRTLRVAYSTGTGFSSPQNLVTDSVVKPYSSDGKHTNFADVNGDSLPDMIWAPWGRNDLWIAMSNGSGFDTPQQLFGGSIATSAGYNISPQSSHGMHVRYGDVNGDGLADQVWYPQSGNSPHSLWVALSNGNGFDTPTQWLQGGGLNTTSNDGRFTHLQDMNGDGLADYFWRPAGQSSMYVALSNGVDGFDNPTIWLNHTSDGAGVAPSSSYDKHSSLADVNGDGLIDYIWVPDGRTDIWVSINTGTDLKRPTLWMLANRGVGGAVSYSWEGKLKYFSDINGDGFADYVWVPEARHSLQYALSNGTGSFGPTQILLPDGVAAGYDPQSHEGQHEMFGDFNGDGAPDWAWVPEGRQDLWLAYSHTPAGKIKKVTNGFGAATEFVYKPMTDSSVYTNGTDALYPMLDLISASYVVSELKTPTGLGSGSRSTHFEYEQLKTHLKGLGSFGFGKMIETDQETGISTETVYKQTYDTGNSSVDGEKHNFGLVDSVITKASDGTVISDTRNSWVSRRIYNNGNRYHAQSLYSTYVNKYDLNGAFMSREGNVYTHDSYNNIEAITSTVYNTADNSSWARTTVTSNSYTNNASNWLIGLMNSSRVDTTVNGKPMLSRESAWTFYSATGRIEREQILHPGTGSVLHETYYSNLDSFGNHRTVTISGADFDTRSTSYTYDVTGRFVASATNVVDGVTHTSSTSYYPTGHINAGLVQLTTGVNGLQSYHEYDAFGRKTTVTAAYGTANPIVSYTSLESCGTTNDCPLYAEYRITKSAQGGAGSRSYVDLLGRTLRKAGQTMDGSFALVDYDYDVRGNNYRVSEPYFAGDTIHRNVVHFDDLGRTTQAVYPNGRTDEITYNGLTKISTNDINGASQSKTEISNVLGQLIQVIDNNLQSVTYGYDSHSNMTRVTDPLNNVTTIGYDVMDRKAWMNDPDKGYWSYTYNSLGQLITQEDAKQQVTCNAYDSLGRMTKRIDNYSGSVATGVGATAQSTAHCAGDGGNPETTTWNYDNAANGIGKIYQIHSQNGYQETVSYDSYSRATQSLKTVNGESFTTNTYYDNLHRVDRVRYPGPSNRLEVKNIYNNLGFNIELANAANGHRYYQALTMDARGNITSENFGNGLKTVRTYNQQTGHVKNIEGYTQLDLLGAPSIQNNEFFFDKLDNLQWREDYKQNIREDFTYDNLNRLRYAYADFGNGQLQTSEVTYDALGNIRSKTGVGNYKYGNECAVAAGPHAVCEITGTKNTTYQYDANGNMETGDGRAIFYTSFDKPSLITKGNNSSLLNYGPSRELVYRRDDNNGQVTTTTYVDGLYEKVVLPSTQVEERHYLAGIGILTIKDRTGSSAGTSQENYLHKDHLGSIVVITDQYAQVKEEFSFDPWGKRRAPSLQKLEELLNKPWASMTTLERGNLTLAPAVLSSPTTNKGFTGHEQLDGVGLIHMGGRVYDAEIGRFISADPFIQDRTNLQALNRYSYVQNNPLSYTDPSGYFLQKLVGKFWKAVKSRLSRLNEERKSAIKSIGRFLNKNPALQFVATVVAYYYCGPYCAAYLGAGLGAAQAYAAGGSAGDILEGLAVAAATSWVGLGIENYIVGNQYIAQMIAAGISAKAQGGKFIDGVKGAAMGMAISWAAGKMIGMMAKPPADPETQTADINVPETSGGDIASPDIAEPEFVDGPAPDLSTPNPAPYSRGGIIEEVVVTAQYTGAVDVVPPMYITPTISMQSWVDQQVSAVNDRIMEYGSYAFGGGVAGVVGKAILSTRFGRAVCVAGAIACSAALDPGQKFKMPLRAVSRHMETRESIRQTARITRRYGNGQNK